MTGFLFNNMTQDIVKNEMANRGFEEYVYNISPTIDLYLRHTQISCN